MVMIADKAIHWKFYSGCGKEDGRRDHEKISVSDFFCSAATFRSLIGKFCLEFLFYEMRRKL